MLLTITNVYPRPDQPQRGLFNAQLFNELCKFSYLVNICLVPSWQVHKWKQIRKWTSPYPAPFKTHYIPVFYIPIIGRNLSWRWYLKALSSLQLDFSKFKYIFTPWLYPDGMAAAILAKRHNIPCWIKVMGSDTFHLNSRHRKKLIAKTATGVTGFFCPSQNLTKTLLSIEVPKVKIHHIPNGIDKNKFFPENKIAAKKQLKKDNGKNLYLFIGNLVDVKGPDILLHAWHQIVVQHPDQQQKSELVVIGTGKMEKSLRAFAQQHNLLESITFIGQVPHALISRWINAADCLCLCSRNEGMPNVVIEATACGTRIVATDVGACRSMLREYPLGTIVPSHSVLPLAEALQTILQEDASPKLLRNYIAAIPSWRDQAEKIFNVFKQYDNQPVPTPQKRDH